MRLRYLLPLVLGFVVGVTPTAQLICEIGCAGPGTVSAQHAHHGTAHGATTVAGSHADGHGHAEAQTAERHHHDAGAVGRPLANAESCCGTTASMASACCVEAGPAEPAAVVAAKVFVDAPAVIVRLLDPGPPIGPVTAATAIGAAGRSSRPPLLLTPLRV